MDSLLECMRDDQLLFDEIEEENLLLKNATIENCPVFFLGVDLPYKAKVLSVGSVNDRYVTLSVVENRKLVQINCFLDKSVKLKAGDFVNVYFKEWQEYHGAVAVVNIQNIIDIEKK